MDLFLREVADRIGDDDVLSKIDALLDWQSFSSIRSWNVRLRARLKSLCLNAMSCDSPGQEPDARHHCPCS